MSRLVRTEIRSGMMKISSRSKAINHHGVRGSSNMEAYPTITLIRASTIIIASQIKALSALARLWVIKTTKGQCIGPPGRRSSMNSNRTTSPGRISKRYLDSMQLEINKFKDIRIKLNQINFKINIWPKIKIIINKTQHKIWRILPRINLKGTSRKSIRRSFNRRLLKNTQSTSVNTSTGWESASSESRNRGWAATRTAVNMKVHQWHRTCNSHHNMMVRTPNSIQRSKPEGRRSRTSSFTLCPSSQSMISMNRHIWRKMSMMTDMSTNWPPIWNRRRLKAAPRKNPISKVSDLHMQIRTSKQDFQESWPDQADNMPRKVILLREVGTRSREIPNPSAKAACLTTWPTVNSKTTQLNSTKEQ